MEYRFQYTNETEKQTILTQNADKILIMEQGYLDGNFLLFSDIKPLEFELKDQQGNQLTIMDAIATIYEGLSAKGSI